MLPRRHRYFLSAGGADAAARRGGRGGPGRTNLQSLPARLAPDSAVAQKSCSAVRPVGVVEVPRTGSAAVAEGWILSAAQAHPPRRLHRPARPVVCPASKAGCCRSRAPGQQADVHKNRSHGHTVAGVASSAIISCGVATGTISAPAQLNHVVPVLAACRRQFSTTTCGWQRTSPDSSKPTRRSLRCLKWLHPDGGIDQHAHGAGAWRWRGASSISGTWPPKAAQRFACCRIKAWMGTRAAAQIFLPGGARPRLWQTGRRQWSRWFAYGPFVATTGHYCAWLGFALQLIAACA